MLSRRSIPFVVVLSALLLLLGAAPPFVDVAQAFTLLTGGYSNEHAANSTLFMGPGVTFGTGGGGPGQTIGPEHVAVPVPRGVARRLRVHVVRGPSSRDVTLTFTLLNTASPFSPISCSVPPPPFPGPPAGAPPVEQSCEDLTGGLHFHAGDRIYLKVEASGGPPAGTQIDAEAITWSAEFH